MNNEILSTKLDMFEKRFNAFEKKQDLSNQRILEKLDELDNKYASKQYEKLLNGLIVMILVAFFGVIIAQTIPTV